MIIRPAQVADADAIARVQVVTWQSTYKEIMPEEFLAGLSHEKHAKNWHSTLFNPDPNKFAYVAEDDGKAIIGFALGGPERGGDPDYSAELYAIYILESFQRQGIGRRLIVTLARCFTEVQLASMLVWVLEANPWRKFYQALGGKFLREKQISVGGVQLVEVAYGWPDARTLVVPDR